MAGLFRGRVTNVEVDVKAKRRLLAVLDRPPEGLLFAVHFWTEAQRSCGELTQNKEALNASGRIWIPRLIKLPVASSQLILRYLERISERE